MQRRGMCHKSCHVRYDARLPCLAFSLITLVVDDNKTKIAKSGDLVPLTRLARYKDLRVQRNATGALLNMTHSG